MPTMIFKHTTPAAEVLPHRRAWATPSTTTFQVISRDGRRRYEVTLDGNGELHCTCAAAEHGLHCWHMDRVAKRLLREGVPEAVVEPETYVDRRGVEQPVRGLKRLAPDPNEVPF